MQENSVKFFFDSTLLKKKTLTSYASRLGEKLRLLKSLQASPLFFGEKRVKKFPHNIITKRVSFQLLLWQFVLFHIFFEYKKLRKKSEKVQR
jgi:hypothetical protein